MILDTIIIPTFKSDGLLTKRCKMIGFKPSKIYLIKMLKEFHGFTHEKAKKEVLLGYHDNMFICKALSTR